MLVMLEPKQAGDYWELIKMALQQSGVPTIDRENFETYPNILASILQGELSVFFYGNPDAQYPKLVAVTGIITDSFSKTKNLILYAVWAVNPVDKDNWLQASKDLCTFARANGCVNVFGYSSNLRMIEIAKGLGFDVSQTLIRMEV